MRIENNLLTGDKISIQNSPNISGKFSADLPDTIVIHFTGGRSARSSANWLCNPSAKASAHVVIGKEGEIIQLVPFDTIAWHAGRSQWQDRSGLNKYSIGIEIDNAGRLEQREQGYYTWFGTKVADEWVTRAVHRNESLHSYWHAFTEAQISATEQLCILLKEVYSIKTIVGHEEISPGRKVDPGPAFPLDKLRNSLIYNDRQSEDTDAFDDVLTPTATVTADALNIRSAPKASANKIAPPLAEGTSVTILERRGNWARVSTEIEGWVSSKFLKLNNKS